MNSHKPIALEGSKIFSGENKEKALSALIITYLFFTVTWLSPESDLRTRILDPVRQFWVFWGLDQNWRLFSPVIRNINFHTTATLTMSDGERVVWQLPQMKTMGLWQKFKDEKFRKWSIDSLPWPDYKEFWPDFARYVGRQYASPANKPVDLSLNLYWIEIPEPGKELKPVKVKDLPAHTKYNTVFYYRFKPEDLQ